MAHDDLAAWQKEHDLSNEAIAPRTVGPRPSAGSQVKPNRPDQVLGGLAAAMLDAGVEIALLGGSAVVRALAFGRRPATI